MARIVAEHRGVDGVVRPPPSGVVLPTVLQRLDINARPSSSAVAFFFASSVSIASSPPMPV